MISKRKKSRSKSAPRKAQGFVPQNRFQTINSSMQIPSKQKPLNKSLNKSVDKIRGFAKPSSRDTSTNKSKVMRPKSAVKSMSYTTKTTIVIDHTFLNEGAKQDPKIQNILIVLNRPIGSKELFLKLLSVTNTIICSDGGANRLRKFVEKHCSKNN